MTLKSRASRALGTSPTAVKFNRTTSVCSKYTLMPDSRAPCCRRLCWAMIYTTSFCVAFLTTTFVGVCLSGLYPWHASCSLQWSMQYSCSDAGKELAVQINQWSDRSGCEHGGQRCLYQLVFSNSTMIKATHTTPVAGYIDDLQFEFGTGSDGVCVIDGYSRSQTWYAWLDWGTNYCNMRNLVTALGWQEIDSFKEVTSNSVCTQYTTADCDKY